MANYLTASGQFFGGDENLNWGTVIDTAKRKGFESFHDYMTFLTQRNKWNKNKRFLIKSATSQLQMLSRFGYLPDIRPEDSPLGIFDRPQFGARLENLVMNLRLTEFVSI